jgi:hypothetical protein
VNKIVQDKVYPEMWRVVRSDGSLSDMVNKSRAMEAAHSTKRPKPAKDSDAGA